jgi:hypothetical protein
MSETKKAVEKHPAEQQDTPPPQIADARPDVSQVRNRVQELIRDPESTRFATFSEGVASLLPQEYPQRWSGVVTKIPSWEPDCILIEEAEVSGNAKDGFDYVLHRQYRRTVKSLPIGKAEAAVNPNAGHRDTGWYTEEAIETGVSLKDRTVRVVHYPGVAEA